MMNGCNGGIPGCSLGGAPPMPLEEVDGEMDLAPLSRDRCNTWPLRRPNLEPSAQTSPLIHEQIPEESDGYDSHEQLDMSGLSVSSNCASVPPDANGGSFSPGVSSASSGLNSSLESSDSPTGKKSTTRRNAWGNMSYADLITQAIIQSPEKRLTLSQVYEWMVQNVPYFRDKGDSNSSAGWKNSIRHNLSLHSRFMRIQNEGAGKSSWWVINPDAKPGRNPRRQRASTLDATNKAAIEKKRRGARKKVMELRAGAGGSTATLSGASSSNIGSTASLAPHELYSTTTEEDTLGSGGAFDSLFRPRAASSSVPSVSARSVVSPNLDHFEDFDFPPWVNADANAVAIPSDILDRTDQMRIDSSAMDSTPSYRRGGNSAASALAAAMARPPPDIKPDIKAIKQEPGVQPPPSYQELSSVRGPQQSLHNPLLRGQLQLGKPSAAAAALPYLYNAAASWMSGAPSCGASAQQPGLQSALPIDLENLTLPDQPLIDMDMESILRHELSQTTNNQLNFDI